MSPPSKPSTPSSSAHSPCSSAPISMSSDFLIPFFPSWPSSPFPPALWLEEVSPSGLSGDGFLPESPQKQPFPKGSHGPHGSFPSGSLAAAQASLWGDRRHCPGPRQGQRRCWCLRGHLPTAHGHGQTCVADGGPGGQTGGHPLPGGSR